LHLHLHLSPHGLYPSRPSYLDNHGPDPYWNNLDSWDRKRAWDVLKVHNVFSISTTLHWSWWLFLWECKNSLQVEQRPNALIFPFLCKSLLYFIIVFVSLNRTPDTSYTLRYLWLFPLSCFAPLSHPLSHFLALLTPAQPTLQWRANLMHVNNSIIQVTSLPSQLLKWSTEYHHTMVQWEWVIALLSHANCCAMVLRFLPYTFIPRFLHYMPFLTVCILTSLYYVYLMTADSKSFVPYLEACSHASLIFNLYHLCYQALDLIFCTNCWSATCAAATRELRLTLY
jgi:hypothetical protein